MDLKARNGVQSARQRPLAPGSARWRPAAPAGARWRPAAPAGARQRPLAPGSARWRPAARRSCFWRSDLGVPVLSFSSKVGEPVYSGGSQTTSPAALPRLRNINHNHNALPVPRLLSVCWVWRPLWTKVVVLVLLPPCGLKW
ncbi:hypothetical protein EYF80_008005 [Liparis tanakae]|uniref:Uncharacterized protein n=1 Tax=Liparis tanakae TaxID=230148 RepID=A0A4Z2IU95_9TELE|nr:hypothetical protein EYF80_008005 [Liparis tanakae]